jgi:hypothetical protein
MIPISNINHKYFNVKNVVQLKKYGLVTCIYLTYFII